MQRVCSQHACGSTPKKCWQEDKYSTREMEEYLKKRMMSIMLCTNWVCAGTFEDHESGVRKHKFPNMLKKWWAWNWIMRLVFRVWYNGACCGFQHQRVWMEHWKNTIWNFESTTRLSTWWSWTQFRDHFGGEHRPRLCMLASVAKSLHKTHRKRGVNKRDVRMDDERESSTTLCWWWWWQWWMQWWVTGTIGRHGLSFNSETMHRVSHSSLCSSPKRWRLSKGKKDNSSLETCHDREARKMARQRVVRKNKVPMATADREWRWSEFTIRGKSPSLKESGEKSLQKWTQWEPLRKKRQIRGTKARKKVRKEKPNCTRWSRLQFMDGKKRRKRKRNDQRLAWGASKEKRREEEDEARNLIEEMQRNPDEAQLKSFEVERKLDRVLWEYIEAFDKERGRPQLIMTKLWQMMQSRDTKNLNLDKDLNEILSKKKRTNRMERSDQDKEVPDARRRRRSITVAVLDSSHRWRAHCPL